MVGVLGATRIQVEMTRGRSRAPQAALCFGARRCLGMLKRASSLAKMKTRNGWSKSLSSCFPCLRTRKSAKQAKSPARGCPTTKRETRLESGVRVVVRGSSGTAGIEYYSRQCCQELNQDSDVRTFTDTGAQHRPRVSRNRQKTARHSPTTTANTTLLQRPTAQQHTKKKAPISTAQIKTSSTTLNT